MFLCPSYNQHTHTHHIKKNIPLSCSGNTDWLVFNVLGFDWGGLQQKYITINSRSSIVNNYRYLSATEWQNQLIIMALVSICFNKHFFDYKNNINLIKIKTFDQCFKLIQNIQNKYFLIKTNSLKNLSAHTQAVSSPTYKHTKTWIHFYTHFKMCQINTKYGNSKKHFRVWITCTI